MDISLAAIVSVVIFGITSLIAVTVWLIRLEGRLDNKKERLIRMESETSDLWKVIEEHRLNSDIHFSLRVATQVEQSNERRFLTIERQLTEINQKLDKMADRK